VESCQFNDNVASPDPRGLFPEGTVYSADLGKGGALNIPSGSTVAIVRSQFSNNTATTGGNDVLLLRTTNVGEVFSDTPLDTAVFPFGDSLTIEALPATYLTDNEFLSLQDPWLVDTRAVRHCTNAC
jgi:hypothetical protein